MALTRDPESLISSLKNSRVVFFGPSWGVVIVDVKDGRPLSVRSSWGDGPGELDRLRGWGEIKYILKPLPDSEPLGTSPVVGPLGPDDLPSNPVLPPGYHGLLKAFFRKEIESHLPDEWMSLYWVFERLLEEPGVRAVAMSADNGYDAMILANTGKFVGAILSSLEGYFYNTEALSTLRKVNMIFPMDVSLLAPPVPDDIATLAFLPLHSEPALRGKGESIVLLLGKASGLLVFGQNGYLVRDGIWEMASGLKIEEEELVLSVSGNPGEAIFYIEA
ncbi:MAG: hypothetical protein ACP5QG_08835 [candidate division WOR-3 bacterium]